MSKLRIANTGASRNAVLVCQVLAWGISLVTCAVAIVVWGHDYDWQLLPINNYILFPLLGLLAFSLMWGHYMASVIRQVLGLEKQVLKRYFEATSLLVLVLICLHPSLLTYQRFRDGFGLPPGSFMNYVAPGMGWLTLLGAASLVAFLAFEFRRLYGDKSWWHFVTEAGDLAMLAIVYHALRLGSHLQIGWYRYLWWFYAVSLVAVLIPKFYRQYKKPGHESRLSTK